MMEKLEKGRVTAYGNGGFVRLERIQSDAAMAVLDAGSAAGTFPLKKGR
jgi:hypothetical protein